MNSIHYRIECEKHGTLLGQCRCPAQNKATRTVPCSWKCPEYVKPLGLCQRCEHPASWHRLDDSTNVSPTDPNAEFRCIGYDCEVDYTKPPEVPCGCPDYVPAPA